MQFLRFLLVGLSNTLLGFAVIIIAMRVLKCDYRIANALGYVVGWVTSFWLNRAWTFRDKSIWQPAFFRWLIVAIVSYGLNLGSIIILHRYTRVGPYAVQVGGAIVYTLASFLGARLFAFRPLASRPIEG